MISRVLPFLPWRRRAAGAAIGPPASIQSRSEHVLERRLRVHQVSPLQRSSDRRGCLMMAVDAGEVAQIVPTCSLI
jgi:hypothetical protein